MEVYILAIILFLMVCAGAFFYLYFCIKADRVLIHKLDDSLNRYADMLSSLTVKVQEHDKELEQITEIAKEAIVNWSEAGKLARKSEEDFNEGLNNILNFQPNVKQKGEEN